jgi:hypothetical protein
MALKEGDRVRITLIGGNYRVKWIGDRVVVLETEDGLGQFLTAVDNLDLNTLPQNSEKQYRPSHGDGRELFGQRHRIENFSSSKWSWKERKRFE